MPATILKYNVFGEKNIETFESTLRVNEINGNDKYYAPFPHKDIKDADINFWSCASFLVKDVYKSRMEKEVTDPLDFSLEFSFQKPYDVKLSLRYGNYEAFELTR